MDNPPITKSKPPKKEYVDSPLNIWVKGLPKTNKSIFFKKLLKNKLFIQDRDKPLAQRKFNNYRKQEVARPDFFDACLIYVTARYADANVKFASLFPYIPYEWAASLIPALIERSLATDNFSNITDSDVKNYKKQDY